MTVLHHIDDIAADLDDDLREQAEELADWLATQIAPRFDLTHKQVFDVLMAAAQVRDLDPIPF